MSDKIEINQINFWLGEDVPFEHSEFPGPKLGGERRELLIKLYKGESLHPWYAIKTGTMEPVNKEDVNWPSTFKSKFDKGYYL